MPIIFSATKRNNNNNKHHPTIEKDTNTHTHSQRGVELELGEMKANLIRLFHFIYAFAFRDSK